uniref:Helix-turn-helix transcriptional regulator n=1 Tax=Phenylobacterium glaciei TaxID=2803784 RepID=A0A974P589_9CAUL|nr:helix-turn-helix transcriptional regulator [Phenylobacterium glaciei]
MPRVLSETDVADFRERLCEAAEKLFAERGPEAVTMRQLASELGVSPMTPTATSPTRRTSWRRCAPTASTASPRPWKTLTPAPRARGPRGGGGRGLSELRLRTPADLQADVRPGSAPRRKLSRPGDCGRRAHQTQTQYVKTLVAEGVLQGDPEEIGKMFWAAAHGRWAWNWPASCRPARPATCTAT